MQRRKERERVVFKVGYERLEGLTLICVGFEFLSNLITAAAAAVKSQFLCSFIKTASLYYYFSWFRETERVKQTMHFPPMTDRPMQKNLIQPCIVLASQKHNAKCSVESTNVLPCVCVFFCLSFARIPFFNAAYGSRNLEWEFSPIFQQTLYVYIYIFICVYIDVYIYVCMYICISPSLVISLDMLQWNAAPLVCSCSGHAYDMCLLLIGEICFPPVLLPACRTKVSVL